MAQRSSGVTTTAWAVTLAAAGLCAYIGIAALLNSAADRPGGIVLCITAAFAALALFRVRGASPIMVAKTILVIGIVQIVAAIVMIAGHWGVPRVIAAMNAVLVAAWVIGAGLFYASMRPRGF